MMRRLAITTGLLVLVLTAGPALAHGPSGSREEDNGRWDNQVKCGKGTQTPVAVVYVGTNGAEVCNQRGPLPLQGRVIATTNQGGYVAADGDKSNPGPEETDGWVRAGLRGGVRCGDTSGRLDSTHPTSKDTLQDCG